jgi:hypothetical protein
MGGSPSFQKLVELEKTLEATYLMNEDKKGLKNVFETICLTLTDLKDFIKQDLQKEQKTIEIINSNN